jgi:protein O-GlcNAc transferase
MSSGHPAAEGDALLTEGRVEEAVAVFTRVLAADPQCQAAWYSLGCARMRLGSEALALECLENSAALAPEHMETQHNLAKCLFDLGLADEAAAAFLRALQLGGGFTSKTALATIVPGIPGADNDAILRLRRRWAQDHLPPRLEKIFTRESPAGKRLRVGYLSSFFGSRNWMKPVWGLINAHDRQCVEIHLFSDGARDGCPGYAPHDWDRFHHITGLPNRDAAALIEAQALDLLIDLNGFSDVNRLAVIAQQPAPVIAGWFNYYATSGMGHYDWLIGDARVIPPEEEGCCTERIARVPGSYLTFAVNYEVPEIAPSPVEHTGRFTFGSLASMHKITPGVVAAWAAILHQTPGSMLLLRNAKLGMAGNCRHLAARFVRHGISEDRLILEGPAEHSTFLQTYSRIDLALDTFPYNGGTTTTEALWQGVPVLTFSGDRWASRTSASLLHAAGLEEWIAPDVETYIQRAAAAAQHPAPLAALRKAMRQILSMSPVCDTAAFAREMEALYFRMAGRA